jgi:hypothetical protein
MVVAALAAAMDPCAKMNYTHLQEQCISRHYTRAYSFGCIMQSICNPILHKPSLQEQSPVLDRISPSNRTMFNLSKLAYTTKRNAHWEPYCAIRGSI